MSTIASTTSTTTATGSTTATTDPGTLDKNGFLKLLVGQLQNMDPMDPQGGMDIGQMAQFSMVEQLTNLAGTTQDLLAQSRLGSVMTLVGRTVTYTDDSGTSVQGVVDHVTVAGGTATLSVDGVSVDPAHVSEVR